METTKQILTKARLDQYIKDNELVPIGTELITIQLGDCKVKVIDEKSSLIYRCETKDGRYRWYNRFFKHEDIDFSASLLDPTPSTVESPFSKEELVTIISDSGYLISNSMNNNELRKSIIAKANHLLTNANEFPKQMLVGDHNPPTIDANVVYIDPQQRFVVVQTEMNYEAYMYFAPIEQKPKELKDLKEDDSVYVICNHEVLPFGSKHKVIRHFELGLVVKAKDGYFITSTAEKILSPYPPTHSQITAAEEAAINEVKARFEKARKGGSNG